MSRGARARRLWWAIHRWIGLGFLILIIPISISGGLLVYHDEFDALITPKRWTVSGPEIALAPSQYIAGASKALAGNEQAMGIRYPRETGRPVIVLARKPAEGGGRPRLYQVFVDPPTGAVLDKVDFRSSLFGFLHVFHENLTIPQYYGRQIVGWIGVGMLILSLTGIWLWWPRHGAFMRALRWRRAPRTSANMHHMFGFWISVPLAIVSLTGIYLSFPQTARTVMSSIAPMQTLPKRPFAAQMLPNPNLSADEALRLAVASEPGSRPASLFLPTAPDRRPEGAGKGGKSGGGAKGGKSEGAAKEGKWEAASPTWRVQVRKGEHDVVTVTIDDNTRTLTRLPDPLAGNRAAQWIRWIHDGSRGGPVWQFVVFLTGVFPPVLAVTGLLMWWRRRRMNARDSAVQDAGEEKLVAAE